MWTLSRYIEACVDTSTHCLHTSKQCFETLMIAKENGLERKKMMYNSYDDPESYVSV